MTKDLRGSTFQAVLYGALLSYVSLRFLEKFKNWPTVTL